MRSLFLSVLSLCVALSGFSQPAFTLTGKIDTDTGTVFLYPIGNAELYPATLRDLKASIVDSHFVFTAEITEPQCFRILGKKGTETIYISDYIILDTGSQAVTCHTNSAHEKLDPANGLSAEDSLLDTWLMPEEVCIRNWEHQFDSLKAEDNGKIDDRNLSALNFSRAQCLALRDSLLLSYVAKNKRSYPAFWKLIILSSYRYEAIYPQTLKTFDTSLQSTYAGKALASGLAVASAMAEGSVFPTISLVDVNGKKKVFGSTRLNAQYTLVDLWFSSCSPCRAQFGALKELYKKTGRSRFSIVGISTDDNNHITQWKKVIQTDKLPWAQFRDANKTMLETYNITQFPTNFLLDKTGKIVRKDLSPGELAAFLATAGQ